MKNFYKLIGVVVFGIVLMSFSNRASAYTEYLDQENTTIDYDQFTFTYSIDLGPGQTFVPTVNRITRIEVPLRYAFETTKLTLYDYNNLYAIKQIASVEKTIISSGGLKWYSFDFSEPIVVTPGNLYAFYLTRIKKGGGYQSWVRNNPSKNPSPYPNGAAIMFKEDLGPIPVAKSDYGFKIYGYTQSAIKIISGFNPSLKIPQSNSVVSGKTVPQLSVPNIVLNVPGQSSGQTADQPDQSSNSNDSTAAENTANNTGNSANPADFQETDGSSQSGKEKITSTTSTTKEVATSAPILSSEMIFPESEGIESPKINLVVFNKEVMDVSEDTLIEIAKGDKLKILGESFANAQVTIMIGKAGYLATADSDGNWEAIINGADVPSTATTVKGQALKNNSGSKIANFFKIKQITEPVANTADNYKNYFYFSLAASGLVVVAFFIVVIRLLKRRKTV